MIKSKITNYNTMKRRCKAWPVNMKEEWRNNLRGDEIEIPVVVQSEETGNDTNIQVYLYYNYDVKLKKIWRM